MDESSSESSSTLPWQDKYKLAKLKIKAWEGEFVAANGSRPDKAALAAAPENIKVAYKTYVHYRKRIENLDSSTGWNNDKDVQEKVEKEEKASVSVSGNEKEKNDNLSQEGKHEPAQSINSQLTIGSDTKKILEEDISKTSDLPQISKPKSSSGTWGRHLNKEACLARFTSKNVESPGSLYSKMAEKMRASGTVKMRTSLKKFSNIDRSVKSQNSDANKSVIKPSTNEEPENGSSTNEKLLDKENIGSRSENLGLFDSASEEPSEKFASFSQGSVFDSLNDIQEKTTDSALNMFSSTAAKVPFRVQKKQTLQRVQTQAVSALTLTPDRLDSTPVTKKKATLNHGWLARCIGSEVENLQVKAEASDEWKMKLTDKEWTEEDHKEHMQAKQHIERYDFQEDEDYGPPKKATPAASFGNKKKLSPQKKQHKDETPESVVTSESLESSNSEKKDVYDFDENEVNIRNSSRQPKEKTDNAKDTDIESPAPKKRGRPKVKKDDMEEASMESPASTRRGRPKVKKDDTGETDNDSPAPPRRGQPKVKKDDAEEADNDSPTPARRGRAKVKNGDVEEANIDSPAPVKRGRPKVKKDDTEEMDSESPALNKKRKRKLTLEELEASGKIQSSWPPPKKVRNSRVQARKKIEANAIENNTGDAVPEVESGNSMEYNELDDIEKHGPKAPISKSYLSKEERFRKKVTTGTANNNFVRINLKKKTFVRGHKHMSGSQYRRQEWKRKQSLKSGGGGGFSGGKSLTCFKCGDFGHWAKFCPGKKGDKLLAIEEYDENESTFLSLEDAAAMALGIKPTDTVSSASKTYPATDPVIDDLKNQTSIKEEDYVLGSDSQDTTSLDENAIEIDENSQAPNENSQEEPPMEEQFQMDADDDLFANIEEDNLQEELSQSPLPSQPINDEDSNSQEPSGNSTYNEQNMYDQRPTIDPLYELVDGEVGPTPREVHQTLKMFGYPSFRPGQENAIMRILSGQSTLLVLSTGSGKSLCYQLPAYLYAKHNNCITLCVSPLVSLMEDQVTGLPKFLHAVCLHTHQNPTQRSNAVNAIRSGRAQILLISPEAVVASRSGGVLGTLLRELPPVAFACLDEAHCVSEWSHNFRPSYLRICQVLRQRLGVKTILGLTATARHSTAISIAKHLLIPQFDTGIIRGRGVPDNLKLSVSRDENREQALISLLQGDRFSECSSIIIYCTRRDECERVATLIRTQLLDPSKVDIKSNLKRSRGMSMDAEAYHAGLSSHRRQQVQKKFMSGKLRIVVATVAFGMGIDKSDVRGIIHFNMPRNVESYVQEIGRAGRDGEEAHCHLFLDALDGKDIQELKRHIYVNSMDRHTVRKFLNKIFKPCACAKVKYLQESCDSNADKIKETENTEENKDSSEVTSSVSENVDENTPQCASNPDSFAVTFSESSCPKHEVAIPINDLVEELDLPSENIETLLCYIELHQSKLIHINNPVYATCTLSCYAGPRQLVAVSRKCPPLGVAIAFQRQQGVVLENKNQVVFPVVDIASRMGWNSKIVKKELKALEWSTQELSSGGKVKRSGVTVEFSNLSFHMDVRGDLSDDECDQLLDALYLRTLTQEREQLKQVQYTYQLLRSVSHGSILMCCDFVDNDRGNRLREELREYFKEGSKVLSEVRLEEQVYIRPEIENTVRSSVRAVLSTHSDNQWTGRAVARVFHGIGSPNFPAEVWGRVRRFWRLHLNVDFNILLKLATQEILRFK